MKIIKGLKQAKDLLSRRPLDSLDYETLRPGIRSLYGKDLSLEETVKEIIEEVKQKGDAALIDLTERIEGLTLEKLEVSGEEKRLARESVDKELLTALEIAARRIQAYHEKQIRHSSFDFNEGGVGYIIRAIEKVGLYSPSGARGYPSTVLMSAIPAKIAGVQEIIVCTPSGRNGRVSATTLAAAELAGVHRIFSIGGAQSIAAMAYGTETIPRVDKIFGPGNPFVVMAKKLVYGAVDIDGIYGPTETVIIADESADPVLCAADMLAQAEHDSLATAILITTSELIAQQTQAELMRQLADIDRKDIAAKSLERTGVIAIVDSLHEALELANSYAPEHLCLMTKDAWHLLGHVKNAGGVFVNCPEALADYMVGPSHVMPTGATARFSSALHVEDFYKVIPVISLKKDIMRKLAQSAIPIAREEGFTGHARALEKRVQGQG